MHQSGAHGALRAQLWKIPPRDCVASAPFDKGVNQWLTIPAASTLPGIRRRALSKGADSRVSASGGIFTRQAELRAISRHYRES